MAETVFFLDGSMDVVLTEKDAYLERLIREKLGDDVARLFRECVTEMQENLAFQFVAPMFACLFGSLPRHIRHINTFME